MGRTERAFVFLTVAYMVVYIPYFFVFATGPGWPTQLFWTLHFTGMGLNFAALVLTIRDLYKRPFPDPNQKLTWLLLILCTGGIGWLIYVFRYAIKPRQSEGGHV